MGAPNLAATTMATAIIWIHIALMACSWGLVLPAGAVFACKLRSVDGVPKGAWFLWHWWLQHIGWLLQVVGAAMAYVYVAEHGVQTWAAKSLHNKLGIVLVALATLQVLGGIARPSLSQERAHHYWAIVHRVVALGLLVGGVYNLWLGIGLLADKRFDGSVRAFS